jgi:hypothetical protein
MKAEPALVLTTKLSLKPRRNCTAGAASEPKVAVAIMQEGVGSPLTVMTKLTGAGTSVATFVVTVTV